MSDLVKDLRTEQLYQEARQGEEDSAELANLLKQAADEIVRLRTELLKLANVWLAEHSAINKIPPIEISP